MSAIFRPVTTISESLKDQDKYLHIHSTILIFYFQTGDGWRLPSIDHLNNVNAFHSLIEKWYKKYGGVASKYLNRYAALFVLVREYSGCDVQEILLSIKKRMHQITDFFRIVDMKSKDLFIYWTESSHRFANIAIWFDAYATIFNVIFTDNESELKNTESFKMRKSHRANRSHLFYCNSRDFQQKGRIEKNHEFIRNFIL